MPDIQLRSRMQGRPAMLIHLPNAESVRHQIAEAAARLKGEPADRYLALLGDVEPTWPPTGSDSPWRLTSYVGSYEDSATIEQAIGLVQRRIPLMRIP